MAATKGKNVRLYILESDEPKLDKLCEVSGMTITHALTTIVSAGLAALEARNNRVTLPLRFLVSDDDGARANYLYEGKKPRGK